MTATEQALSAYSAQAFFAATDILPIQTAGGVGYKVAGSVFVAQQSAGGNYIAGGPIQCGTVGGVALQIVTNSAIRNATNGASTTYFDVSVGGATHGSFSFRSSNSFTERLFVDGAGPVRPGSDNAQTLGTGAFRWSTVYAGTGTINTSDERYKVWIGQREDRRVVYQRIARAIMDELGWYQFADAVAEKGEDGARWHFGARAQRVWEIFAREKLAPPLVGEGADQQPDPDWQGLPPPAMLCFDRWDDVTDQRPVYSETLLDPDGNPALLRTETVVTRAAGSRFGFRLDQLGLLIDWGLHQRLTALEAGK